MTFPHFHYRLLTTGSIEEKIFQRQAHKKALSSTVVDNNEQTLRHFTVSELRELFKLEDTESDTHKKLKCVRCVSKVETKSPPEDADCTSDVANWYHCWNKKGLADIVSTSNFTKVSVVRFKFQTNVTRELST